MQGKVVLICFRKAEELKKTFEYLLNSELINIFGLVIVQEGNVPEVSATIPSTFPIPVERVQTSYLQDISVRSRINANIYRGISDAFRDLKTDFVTVLEDDILVSTDYFIFLKSILAQYENNPRFRGVNGFSGIPASPSRSQYYVRNRFGLGWGWSITRKTWIELMKIWHGNEDEHWDGLIEKYIKSGFVVMPEQSRVMNIGFGRLASHTQRLIPQIPDPVEIKIFESFVKDPCSVGTNFLEAMKNSNWRDDCLPYLRLKTMNFWISQFLYSLDFRLSRILQFKYADLRLKPKISSILLRIQKILI